MKLPDFDPVLWTMERHARAPLALTYKPANKRATEAWQKKLRVETRRNSSVDFPRTKRRYSR